MTTSTGNLYRTLIQARIEQLAGLSVGGTLSLEEHPDTCYRDGLGRLTIPASSLCGALVETAARLFPSLVHNDRNKRMSFDYQITGKKAAVPEDDSEEFLQSVWRFRHAHLREEQASTEWRQGVGIRQATGATAREKRALYDFEVVPRGTQWTFFLEIDTFRGDAKAEALAILALNEWMQQRGWLGRGPARGTGWIKLHVDRLLRLPRSEQAIKVWPNNTTSLNALLDTLSGMPGVTGPTWSEALDEARQLATQHDWQYGTWHYLSIPITLCPGPSTSQYGYDVLQVAGHPAGELNPNALQTQTPLSTNDPNWRGEFQQPDAPFVNTHPMGKSDFEPFLPGGGLRGPLRHTASRLARATGADVRDPNWNHDPLAEKLSKQLEVIREVPKRQQTIDQTLRPDADQITQVFGAEELCGRLLVRDGELCEADYALLQTEHHAEDEFTGGVFAGSKFDRQVLASGTLGFELLLEAPDFQTLKRMAEQILPALELARLGHVPIGGGKWRGAGWMAWKIDMLTLVRAGMHASWSAEVSAEQSLSQPVSQLWEQASGATP